MLLPGVVKRARLMSLSPWVLRHMPEVLNLLLVLLLLSYLLGAIGDYAACRPVQTAGLA